MADVVNNNADTQWANKFSWKIWRTLGHTNALTLAQNELAQAVGKSEAWRVRHLLNTEFKRLGRKAVKLNARADLAGSTVLGLATKTRSIATVSAVMDSGANPFEDHGHPFQIAAANKDTDMFLHLMRGKKMPGLNEREKEIVLSAAIVSGDIAFINELRADLPDLLKADKNEKAPSPLYIALEQKATPEMVSFLMTETKGELQNASAARKSLLLHEAICKRNEAVALALLDMGADVNGGRSEFDRATPLMRAAQYALPGVVAALIEKGADTTLTDRAGKSAVEYIVRFSGGAATEETARTLSSLFTKGEDFIQAAQKIAGKYKASDGIKDALIREIETFETRAWQTDAQEPSRISFISKPNAAGVILKQTFNFASGEVLTFTCHQKSANAELMMRENMSDFTNQKMVEEARTQLAKRAGPKS